jgi:hypothetical protein
MQGMLTHNRLIPFRFLVKIPPFVMIITPFYCCRAASPRLGRLAVTACPHPMFASREV